MVQLVPWVPLGLMHLALAAANGNLCSDALGALGGGVSFLQASKKLWAPPAAAAPAASSLNASENTSSQPSDGNATNATNVSVDITDAVNFSEIAEYGGEVQDESDTPSTPYADTNSTEPAIPVIEPIQKAVPLPELDAENLTGDLRDCIMGFWSEWSECQKGTNGFKGPHQIRQREIIQPWMPNGQPCGAQSEAKNASRNTIREKQPAPGTCSHFTWGQRA
eukprot:CAMPEP_0181451728 /NCGR_PEP_ID=MMETSP1110-20121109/28841_1 /TAXON_ID=174948 /ORGANISM="Symbiodinium sp., Strain CCMP421" /LENGTH=221 /DNA_ID=CAMNT_0023575989 /DNA_START=99 /DNA_END=761 /DNA_ORIENTATION=+